MDDIDTSKPLRRQVTAQERDAAIFLIGMDAAFGIRGFPRSYPRKVFNSVMNTALAIAGKVGKTNTVGAMDYPELQTMMNTANEFGFIAVRAAD